jgi:hypothetical protein
MRAGRDEPLQSVILTSASMPYVYTVVIFVKGVIGYFDDE